VIQYFAADYTGMGQFPKGHHIAREGTICTLWTAEPDSDGAKALAVINLGPGQSLRFEGWDRNG